MTDDLHARIKEEVLDGILSMFSENDPVEMAAGYITDAVIRELNLDISHTYRTSQGREVCIEGFWTEEVTDD